MSRYLAFQRISLSFRKKLIASLLYPCLLIVMVLALFVFLISFVVPRFAMLYDQLGTNLPRRHAHAAGRGQQLSALRSVWNAGSAYA